MQEISLKTEDGAMLAATRFAPDGEARGTVLLLGAWGVRQRYYRRFATWLAGEGFQVLTFDYRGIGASLDRPIRSMRATTSDWGVRDAGAAFSWLSEQPGPHLAVGHSFGGQVLGLSDTATQLDGIYMVASQLAHHSMWTGPQRLGMWAISHLALPLAPRLFGYLPAWMGVGEDIPAGAAIEWGRWLRSPGYLLDHVPRAADRFSSFPSPIELVGFTDDSYAPPPGVRAMADALPDSTNLRILEPAELDQESVGHFGFFRAGAQSMMWQDCLGIMDRWAPPSVTEPRAAPGGTLD